MLGIVGTREKTGPYQESSKKFPPWFKEAESELLPSSYKTHSICINTTTDFQVTGS